MILDDAKVARKAREQHLEERRQDGRATLPVMQETAPPAYEPIPSTSAAFTTTPTFMQPQFPQQLQPGARSGPESGSQPQPSPERRRSPLMRFFSAFVIALIVYIFTGWLVLGILNVSHGYLGREPPRVDHPWGKSEVPWKDDGAIVPNYGCEPASFEDIAQAVPSADYAGFLTPRDNKSNNDRVNDNGPYKSVSSFTIPSANVKHLYAVSRGAHAKGSFQFTESDVENVEITITWEYWHKGLATSVNMCTLENNGTSKGFGIFTPRVDWNWMPPHRRFVTFEVLVRIPRERDSQITAIHSHLENFNQTIIASRQWDSVRLHGSNGAILTHGTLSGRHLSLVTANARIEGSFFSESSLLIETSDAHIDAKVELLNELDSRPTTANLITTNAEIHSTWQLSALRYRGDSWPGYGGSFDISATTTNGAMQQKMVVAPIQPNIQFAARTTNAASIVSLYRTFEGQWGLKSQDAVAITRLEPEDDPEGHHRTPHLRTYGHHQGVCSGAFWWKPSKQSTVEEPWLADGPDGEGPLVEVLDRHRGRVLPSRESFAKVTTTNGKLWLSFI